MSNDEKIDKMIRSYRFTVVVLSVAIVSMFALSAYILLVQVPDHMYAVLEDFHADRVLIEEQ
jgi:hypothetical protein